MVAIITKKISDFNHEGGKKKEKQTVNEHRQIQKTSHTVIGGQFGASMSSKSHKV